MAEPTLVILAAGRATRFGRPKQLEPVGPRGRAILDYTLLDGYRAGFRRFVVVIRESLDSHFRRHLESARWPGGGPDPVLVHQPVGDGTGPWGTGHAVWATRNMIEGPFAVANADDYYGPSSLDRIGSFLQSARHPDSWGLVGFRVEYTLSPNGGVSRGICQVDPEGSLLSIREATGVERGPGGIIRDGAEQVIPDGTLVSMNLWAFGPEVFPLLETGLQNAPARSNEPRPEFQLPDAVGGWIAHGLGDVEVLTTEDRWFGLTHPQDLAGVELALSSLHDDGIYPG